MKRFGFLVFSLMTNIAVAAPISVASYVFDDSAFVTNVTSMTGSIFSSTGSTNAITDLASATYVYSSNSGSMGLLFGNATIYNGEGADVALFFLGNLSTVSITLDGSNTSRNYTSQYIYLPGGGQYGVRIGNQVYSASVALVNLDDFGLGLNDKLGGFRVGLGVNNYMSLVAGFHTAPISAVPLPAPFVLLYSGLAALGVVGRRK